MTLILLHGFMGSAEGMKPLADQFDGALGEAVAIDLLGHGEAAKPADVEAYTMHATVEYVASQIREISPDEPIDLFGYSMGGRVALSLAVAHPQLVRRLAVLGASPGLADTAERIARQDSDHVLADRLEREGLEAFVDHWLSLPMFAALPALGAEWFREYRQQRLTGEPTGFANSLRGAGTGAMPPLHDRLAELAMPILFLAGANDEKFANLGASMSAAVADGSLVVIDGAGHAAHLEAPDLVIAAVSAFLR